MTSDNGNGKWISIVEYSSRYAKSISTLRRYIKSHKIKYQMQNGRYLIWEECPMNVIIEKKSSLNESEELKKSLQEAQQEILELKMLVNLYEKNVQASTPSRQMDVHSRS